MTSMDDFHLSEHFVDRALDMALTAEDIREVLLRPDTVRPSVKYRDCHNFYKGDLTFGVKLSIHPHIVLTAVWSSEEAWKKDFALGEYGGRKLRN